jgi:hypothetical protein
VERKAEGHVGIDADSVERRHRGVLGGLSFASPVRPR